MWSISHFHKKNHVIYLLFSIKQNYLIHPSLLIKQQKHLVYQSLSMKLNSGRQHYLL